MSRETWHLIIHSKHFYVHTYRRVGNVVLLSMILNFCLGCGLYYVYFNRPDAAYYATNGITAPDRLTSMDMPNDTSAALLAEESATPNYNNKPVPQ